MNKIFGVLTVFMAISALLFLSRPVPAQADGEVIYACVNKIRGNTRIVSDPSECRFYETVVSWNEEGMQGPKGETGDQGPKGMTGDQGPKGMVGNQGSKGETGDQGPKGMTGDQEPKGMVGNQGPKGETGDQGTIGEPGDGVTIGIITSTEERTIGGRQENFTFSATACCDVGLHAIGGGCEYTPSDLDGLGDCDFSDGANFCWFPRITENAPDELNASCWHCGFAFQNRLDPSVLLTGKAFVICADVDLAVKN